MVVQDFYAWGDKKRSFPFICMWDRIILSLISFLFSYNYEFLQKCHLSLLFLWLFPSFPNMFFKKKKSKLLMRRSFQWLALSLLSLLALRLATSSTGSSHALLITSFAPCHHKYTTFYMSAFNANVPFHSESSKTAHSSLLRSHHALPYWNNACTVHFLFLWLSLLHVSAHFTSVHPVFVDTHQHVVCILNFFFSVHLLTPR